MFLYFLISILVNNGDVEAAPIRVDDPQGSQLQLQRTMFGIIWSCLSTIIICAWTSVHPNVPPPNQWKARWNRLKLMFWMIIAPELVLAWAVRQFFGAREIRDAYNERYPDAARWKKWTLKHGHFLQMGGFNLVDPDQKDAEPHERNGIVLTLDYFDAHPDIEIPAITAAEIEDKSRGDGLSKVIAVLQTTWFIVQCIARGLQGLALTELELATLALASLNAVTFAIWWHKPLGVREPVKIYLKMEGPKGQDGARQEEDRDISVGDVMRMAWKVILSEFFQNFQLKCWEDQFGILVFMLVCLPAFIILLPFFFLVPVGTVLLLRIIKTRPVPQDTPQRRGLLAARIVVSLQSFRYRLTSVVTEFVGNRLAIIYSSDNHQSVLEHWYNAFILLPLLFLFLLLFTIVLMPFFIFVSLVSFIFAAVFGIVATVSIFPGADHVPSFYAPTTESDRWSRMVVFALFGIIFGGLHCIGWNFKFPTHVEQLLWQTTSLAITAIPLVVAPIDFLLVTLLGNRDIKDCGKVERVILLTLDLVMTILLFIYVPARLFLIGQALALLRSQPPSALTSVDWTEYFPHLFSES